MEFEFDFEDKIGKFPEYEEIFKKVYEFLLKKLCKPIYEGKCEAAFSRQICDNQSIEKYTRINNYPKESRIVSKKDTERLGIVTFFFSDAASAVKRDIYVKLNGYDGKDFQYEEKYLSGAEFEVYCI